MITLPVISDYDIIIAFRKFRPQEFTDHDADNGLCFFFIAPMIKLTDAGFNLCKHCLRQLFDLLSEDP